MGWGFWFTVTMFVLSFARSVRAYQRKDRSLGRHHVLTAEVWLAAALIIGSLK